MNKKAAYKLGIQLAFKEAGVRSWLRRLMSKAKPHFEVKVKVPEFLESAAEAGVPRVATDPKTLGMDPLQRLFSSLEKI
jgi:hypothetical protein